MRLLNKCLSDKYCISLPNLIVLSYGIIESLKYYGFIPVIIANGTGVILGSISLLYVLHKKGQGSIKPLMLFFGGYTICGFLSLLYNDNMQIVELLWPFFFLGYAALLLNFKVSSFYAKVSLYTFLLVTIYFLLFKGELLYNMDTSESRNYCSVYLLSLYGIYIICRVKENNYSIPWLELLLCWLMCIIAMGRGGIVTSTVLVVLSFLYQLSVNNGVIKIIRILSVSILLVGILLLFLNTELISLYEYVKTYIDISLDFYEKRGGIESSGSRGEFWSQYLSIVFSTPLSLFVAPHIGGTAMLNDFSENLHNSYLMLYARYGTLIFFTIVFMLIRGSLFLKAKRQELLLIVLLIICLRCFTDVMAFNGVMDILFYYFMFYSHYYKLQSAVKK